MHERAEKLKKIERNTTEDRLSLSDNRRWMSHTATLCTLYKKGAKQSLTASTDAHANSEKKRLGSGYFPITRPRCSRRVSRKRQVKTRSYNNRLFVRTRECVINCLSKLQVLRGILKLLNCNMLTLYYLIKHAVVYE